MKKWPFIVSAIFFLSFHLHAQGLKNLVKSASQFDSANKSTVQNILHRPSGAGLSTDEIANGLKEALGKGANNASQKLSSLDGFFKNAAIKILMPEEARKVEKTMRNMGMGSLVDDAILSMNRAAEDAAKEAAPIFLNAIKSMNIQDAVGILKGGDHSATNYLKGKTTTSLTAAFRPVIENSLKKVDATKYWNTVFSTYNKFSFNKVNPDLSAYVTDKALNGIFYQIAIEEQTIRKDPAARTTELLKKVFAN